MTQTPSDIVAKLRAKKPGYELARYGETNPDGPEAADLITDLLAAVERQREEIDKLRRALTGAPVREVYRTDDRGRPVSKPMDRAALRDSRP